MESRKMVYLPALDDNDSFSSEISSLTHTSPERRVANNSDADSDRSTPVKSLEIDSVSDHGVKILIAKATSSADTAYENIEINNQKSASVGITNMSFVFPLIMAFFAFPYFATDKKSAVQYPPELLGNVYKKEDFRNELNIVPSYWDELEKSEVHSVNAKPHMGPCYLPQDVPANWTELIEENRFVSGENIKYKTSAGILADDNLEGLCRPGFIIIGAGKCGTSSLYHYLVGHPRVLPAKAKQINFFKNYTDYPMKWYLQQFPPAEVFLSKGALMTGEASPGYLPYPNVANRLKTWMQERAGNGKGQAVGSPKIITIARDPLDRSWSSYKYNYQKPLIDRLRKEDLEKNIHHDTEWYMQNFVFSFEDLVSAELKVLKKCLKPGGKAEKAAEIAYGNTEWATSEFSRRKAAGEDPLVVLDESSCYEVSTSKTVPRRQWEEIAEKNPSKIIDVDNLHVVQSIVGRSLYVLPLEWWYGLYRKEDLYLFCNEDLRHRSVESMSSVTSFLGLPSFDFTNVTSVGMYNTGGNTGYDTVTRWDKKNVTAVVTDDQIPISEELRREYMEFVEPYNERLYRLVGKRCNWSKVDDSDSSKEEL